MLADLLEERTRYDFEELIALAVATSKSNLFQSNAFSSKLSFKIETVMEDQMHYSFYAYHEASSTMGTDSGRLKTPKKKRTAAESSLRLLAITSPGAHAIGSGLARPYLACLPRNTTN